MNRSFALVAALAVIAPAVMLAAADPAGLWEGTLNTPNGNLPLTINIHRDADKWIAEADIPMQGVAGLPLGTVKVDGAAIGFSMPGQGDPHYDGKLSDDGKAIAGSFNVAGQSIPMDLKWKSQPKAVESAPANTGDVTVLVGVWEGTLDANGTPLHLRFNFTKKADGSIAGTLDSLDQGANGLPITSISHTGDAVKLDMKVISGSYDAALNKEATTMTGTFQQGGGPGMPLTMQRKSAEKKN